VRPSAATNARLPVEAYEAIRAPGRTRAARSPSERRPERTADASTRVPDGSVTTTTSGALFPPFP
jgi:hypothetical protein